MVGIAVTTFLSRNLITFNNADWLGVVAADAHPEARVHPGPRSRTRSGGDATEALSLGRPVVWGGGLKLVHQLPLLEAPRGVKHLEER